MVARHLGAATVAMFRTDLTEGRLPIEWGGADDLQRALELDRAYRDLSLGLVDGVVMAMAERLEGPGDRDPRPARLRDGQPEGGTRNLAAGSVGRSRRPTPPTTGQGVHSRHFPRVKSGNSTGALPFATLISDSSHTALSAAAS